MQINIICCVFPFYLENQEKMSSTVPHIKDWVTKMSHLMRMEILTVHLHNCQDNYNSLWIPSILFMDTQAFKTLNMQ